MRSLYVIGSINCDYSIHVPEAPQKGETVVGNNFYFSQGGKGANQAVALQKMSPNKVKFLACLGDDQNGRLLIQELEKNGIDISHLVIKNGKQSGACLITIFDNTCDNIIIINKGANDTMTTDEVDHFLENAQSGDILISQLEIPMHIVEYAFRAAKLKNMFVVLNPSPINEKTSDRSLLKYVDLLIPNETELEKITNHKIINDKDIYNCYKILNIWGVKSTLVTLGDKGSLYIDESQSIATPSRKVKAVDTTAAGDTFLGSYIAQFSIDKPIKECLIFATIASSITVTRFGASQSIPTLKEVQEVLRNIK